ncbi:MAG: FAD-dependent oxidoreductase, partial [Clostridia bacterium]|nr:FAD-dependent oxidoreductase [Clostridia bacterium]
VAAGRKGNTKGLERLGLRMEKGYICIDEHMRTNVPHVYAIGDVTGGLQLAHVASAQGAAAAENICGHDAVINYDAIPNCIFTVPEIAAVGMTEERAKQTGISYTVGKFPMRASGRAMTLYETDGFTKLICEKESGRLLGAEIIGPNATEMICELAYAVRTKGTAEDLHQTIHPHPTVSETIREAAGIVVGKPMSI